MAFTYPQACEDPNLFLPWFTGESWNRWRVVDKALFGIPLDADELAVFKELTGRDAAPMVPAREAWLICGRRSGKDVKASSLAVYLATIGAEQSGCLSRLTRGERGVVQILAVDRDQAQVCLGYVREMLEQPLLKQMVVRDVTGGIELSNGLSIEIATNDQRRVRGRTVIACVFDEVAHWRSENSSSPDVEVYNAVLPAMSTIPNALLIGISSPYAKRGLVYNKFRKHWGQDGDVLVVKAPSWVMNPNLSRDAGAVAKAYADDPAWASAEYGAEFRTDVEAYISREVVEGCVISGRLELLRAAGVTYRAFTDPSGGSNDAMTLAIGHMDGGKAIVDCIRVAQPPFSPDEVVREFCDTIKSYGIYTVTGDNYADQWPKERFSAHGVNYVKAEKPKGAIYTATLPFFNSGNVELPEHQKLIGELCGLERRVARGGRDSIDHERGQHDDVANSVCGLIWLASQGSEALAGLSDYLGPDGEGVETPRVARLIYATAFVETQGVNVGQTAIAIFADSRYFDLGLVLCDFLVGTLSDALLLEAIEKMRALADATNSPAYTVISDKATVSRYEALSQLMADPRAIYGGAVEPSDPRLPALAASHVAAGKVRISKAALAKAQSSTLGAALSFEFGRRTELSVATMIGITSAYEMA